MKIRYSWMRKYHKGVKVRMTATTTTTQLINDMIGWTRKNNRAARAARTLVQFFDVICKRRRENFKSEVQTTTPARSSKYFFVCFYMKNIRARTVRLFIQRDHLVIVTVAKHLTDRKALFLKLPNMAAENSRGNSFYGRKFILQACEWH